MSILNILLVYEFTWINVVYILLEAFLLKDSMSIAFRYSLIATVKNILVRYFTFVSLKFLIVQCWICISEEKSRDTVKDNHVYNLKLESINILLVTSIFKNKTCENYRIIPLRSKQWVQYAVTDMLREKTNDH